MNEETVEILSTISASIMLALLFLWLIYVCIETSKTAKMKQDFKKNLQNEHDKALIMDYENTKWTLRKKDKK